MKTKVPRMKTKPLIYACFTLVIFASNASIQANNNLFLPGDAFFPTVLARNDVETLQTTKTGERKFAYSSFGGYEGAFCGYAGYANASIPAVDDAFARNLATVYERIRKYQARELVERTREGETELIETNGIRVLFYPAEFQFPRHTLGLRYNENWVAEGVKFGHQKESLRLCCLIPDPAAVEVSWRDADVVPPLPVKLPDVEIKPVPETVAPVVVEGSVKAIVIDCSLKELFHQNDSDYLSVYIVDSKGITELTYSDGTWRTEDSE